MLTFMRGRAARKRILRRMNHRWNLRSRTRADHLDPEEGGIQEVCWPELPKTQNCRRYCYCHSKNWTSGRRRPTRIFDWQRIGTWHSYIGSFVMSCRHRESDCAVTTDWSCGFLLVVVFIWWYYIWTKVWNLVIIPLSLSSALLPPECQTAGGDM